MRLYPAIDIIDGQAVRLTQGNYSDKTLYDKDPVAVAKKWAEAGASYVHVVDLDGALDGKWANEGVITTIAQHLTIPIQTGGGIRSLEDIKQRLDAGVARVILGTVAIKAPEIVAEAVARFGPEKIVVGIDAKDGMVAVHGWEEVSSVTALALCEQMKGLGITTIVYTDIAKDGMMQGPNGEATEKLARATGLEIIASGGVATYKDLEDIKTRGVAGCIIGKALYTGAIDLKTAVERYERR